MDNEDNERALCCPGCKMYTGGEIRHFRDCVFYPDSLSRMYDEKDSLIAQYKEALINIRGMLFADSSPQTDEDIQKASKILKEVDQLLNREVHV